MNLFYILGRPLGYVMEWIYNLIPNYGWDIILFTLLIRLISLPLTIYQQKSMAKMAVFQPMITDIQKKYKNNQEKQAEEMTKLQQDFGYNPMSGCMPMFLNFFVMFGVIEVVYKPLQRIFHIPGAVMGAAQAALTGLGINATIITRDTHIIEQVMAGESTVIECFSQGQLDKILGFSGAMNFFGIDLTQVPSFSLAPENLPLLIFPILSLVTMFLSTHFSMKASGQQMQGGMKLTMYLMPLMMVYFSFTVPVAFSLYYTVSNVLMIVQSEVMRRVYNPEKVKAQIEAEIKEKRKQQKRGVKNTVVKVKDKDGNVVEKNVSASEMNRMRLEYARKLDEERYKDERTVPLSELNKKED